MSVSFPEIVIAAPSLVATGIYVAKRLFCADLELRTQRARARKEYDEAVTQLRAAHPEDVPRDLLTAFKRLTEITTSGGDGKHLYTIRSKRHIYFLLERTLLYGDQKPPRVPSTEVPTWALCLLDPVDAERYAIEWAAHLHQRITDGELREAARDRRQLARRALKMAAGRRLRRARAQDR